MPLCIICNKSLRSPLPAECHFPMDENDRNILLIGLFRAKIVTEDRVKSLNRVANSSTGLCHSHISQAALSYLPSSDDTINYADPCGELKRGIRFGVFFQHWKSGFSAELKTIATQLQLDDVPSFGYIFPFLETAVNCGCEDGLASDCQKSQRLSEVVVLSDSDDDDLTFNCSISESDSARRHISIRNMSVWDVKALTQLMLQRGLPVEDSYLSESDEVATQSAAGPFPESNWAS